MMKYFVLIGCVVTIISCKKENKLRSEISTKPLVENNKLNSLEDIKAEYKAYNLLINSKKMDSLSFNYKCNNEIEGTVVYYLEKNKLKMIKNSYIENSHFSSVENYYVKDGVLFFIFKQETVWQFDGGTPEKPETKDDVKEQRFYIIDNKLIQSLEKEYTIQSSKKNILNPEQISNIKLKIIQLKIYKKVLKFYCKIKVQKTKKCVYKQKRGFKMKPLFLCFRKLKIILS